MRTEDTQATGATSRALDVAFFFDVALVKGEEKRVCRLCL